MKQFFSRAIIASAVLALFTSCEQKTSGNGESKDEVITSWPATKETDKGNFTVTLSPKEGGIEGNKHFSLNVEVKPKQPGGLGGATVLVNADMPAHRHGMNTQPEISSGSSNSYQVDGMLFHMTGYWVINVDITKDGKTEQALFPVQVE